VLLKETLWLSPTQLILEKGSKALATETKAAEVYGQLLPLLEEIDDRELYDAVEQIYLAELRSVGEIRLLLD
jgi:hypothetical protein